MQKEILNLMKINLTKSTIALLIYYTALVLWWSFIYINGYVDLKSNYLFGAALALIPLFGGVIGIIRSKNWGYFNSHIGKFLMLLSLGLITWSIGTLIFAVYNLFLSVEVPYPSLADVAYIVSWPLWALAMISISFATGMRFQIKRLSGKIFSLSIPLVVAFISYYLLIVVARGGEIIFSLEKSKVFFDLAYPLGDVIILTLSLLIYGLSFNYLGGTFKKPILIILFGFVLNYFADFSFSYTTTIETFYVGSWVDFIFMTAMMFLAIGVTMFDSKSIDKN